MAQYDKGVLAYDTMNNVHSNVNECEVTNDRLQGGSSIGCQLEIDCRRARAHPLAQLCTLRPISSVIVPKLSAM